MSQTYRIGTLNFTGSQAVLSSSLDVSGSGRFTDGLTVTGSITASGDIAFANSGQRMEGNPNLGNWTFRNSSGQGWYFEWLQNGSTAMLLSQQNNLLVGTTDTSSFYRMEIARNLLGSGSLKVDTTLYVTGSSVGINTPTPSASLDVSGSGRFTNGLTSSGSITLSMLSTDDGSGNYDSNRLFFRGLGVGAVPQQGSIYLDANNGAGGEFLNITSDGGVRISASTLNIPSAITNVGSQGISLTANSTTNGLLLRQGYNQTSGYLLNVVNDYHTSSLAIHANSYNTVVGRAITPSDTGYTLQVLNTGASGSLFVSGSTTITDVLTLPFQHPLPSNKATGSVALSGSGGTFEGMYVYNGTSWINVKA